MTEIGNKNLAVTYLTRARCFNNGFHNPIDLLVFDVMLPKKSGPEAYAEISKRKAGLPIIFATGYSADIALLHKAEMQGAMLLQKPYIPRDLARRVRETLDQHVPQHVST